MTGPGNQRRKSLDPNSFVSRKEAMGLAQHYAGQAAQAAANDTKALLDRIEKLEARLEKLANPSVLLAPSVPHPKVTWP